VADGFLEVPMGPGLGVELDEKAVVEYARGESPVLVGRKTD
jgi:L-alanine-DL-glutamate epimerase-like enolase superfamily enzyme